MTHFPRHSRTPRFAPVQAASHGNSTPPHDVLWGRPLFKAPSLPNPRIAFDPLPFFAQRITQRPVGS
ncbi:MAG TPA: hypothetical protein VGM73_03210 [Candidatus Didemnitutus sp.]